MSHVPFKVYWSTYDDMDERQEGWYFYWREQARQGNYLPTSLSYIFVHVYELINQVGVRNATDGYGQLIKLWLHYRVEHDRLDYYLADWLADYVALYLPQRQPLEVYALPPLTYTYASYFVDYLLPLYVNDRLADMPLELLNALVDYGLDRSHFYEKHPAVLKATLPKVLAAVEAQYPPLKEGLFARFRPSSPTEIRRYPFQSAIYGGPSKQIYIATIDKYSQSQKLRQYLTGVVKYTENLLREQYNVRGRLKAEGINQATRKIIERVVNVPQAAELTILMPPVRRGVSIAQHFIESFVEKGRALAKKRVAKASLIPFASPYPTYNDLSEAQEAWYLFWREEVRNGRYPQTERNYLTLYAAELLHTIGVATPQESLNQLQALWTHYGRQYPMKSRTLINWIMAYTIMHPQLGVPLQEVLLWPKVFETLQAVIPDAVMCHYLSIGLGEADLILWEHYLDYNLRKSHFWAVDEYRELMTQRLPYVLTTVNQQCAQHQQTSLFDQYRPTATLVWPVLFCHLPPPAWPSELEFVDVPLYSQVVKLRATLTAIVKQTENKLREAHKVRGRLKVTGLDETLKGYIDQALFEVSNPNRTKKIDINFAQVDTLRQETQEVLDLLVVQQEEETTEIPEPVPVEPPTSVGLTTDASPPSLADEDEMWGAFAGQLSQIQIELLQLILQNGDAATPAINQLAAQNQTMPALLLDHLNEMAQHTIGDIVLDAGPPVAFVDAYYREMIEQILP